MFEGWKRWMLTVLAISCALGVVVAAQTKVRQKATVTADAPIYISPEASQTALRVAAPHTVLNVLQEQADWVQVEFNDPQWGRRIGWIQRSLVAVEAEELKPMDLSVPDSTPTPSSPPGPAKRPCVILTGEEKKLGEYHYLEGQLPNGVKLRKTFTGKDILEIQRKGGYYMTVIQG
jgi:hypothetical protein